jgi:hypothetical protein
MIYLIHDENDPRGTHAPLQPLRTHLATPHGTRAADVPEMQDALLEPTAGTQDQTGTAGGGARC